MRIADRHYFERRAEQEIEMAQTADDPLAVQVHYELAGYYPDRVYGPTPELARAISVQP